MASVVKGHAPCWICGSPADTGEHILKRADIVKVRGAISQQNPVLLTRDYKRYTIGSAKNDRVKYDDMLCAKCNNQHVQPFDLAWDTFRDHVLPMTERNAPRRASTSDIFGEDRKLDLYLHLYFAKVLGCALASNDLPTTDLRTAILNATPATNLRVLFRSLPRNKDLFLSSIFAVVKGKTTHSVQCASDVATLRCVIVLGNLPQKKHWPPSAWFPRSTPSSIVIWPEHKSRLDTRDAPAYRPTAD